MTENEESRATFRGCCNNPKEKRCGPGPSLCQKHGEEKKSSKDVKEEEFSEKSTLLRIGAEEERRVGWLPGSR